MRGLHWKATHALGTHRACGPPACHTRGYAGRKTAWAEVCNNPTRPRARQRERNQMPTRNSIYARLSAEKLPSENTEQSSAAPKTCVVPSTRLVSSRRNRARPNVQQSRFSESHGVLLYRSIATSREFKREERVCYQPKVWLLKKSEKHKRGQGAHKDPRINSSTAGLEDRVVNVCT